MANEAKFIHALKLIGSIGSHKLSLLCSAFPSFEQVWTAGEDVLRNSGIGGASVERIVGGRAHLDPELEWAKLERAGIEVLTIKDDAYPALLRECPDRPFLLYARGDLKALDKPMVAIVGSRKSTAYGRQVAHNLAHDLAQAGVSVVSGLAFGIDCQAHLGALSCGGITIAVMGNGVDEGSIAPRANLELSKNIVDRGGLLLSEFPPGTAASPGTFPARNRIMAAMSLGTLVVEAARKSGSLITANLALDYNRDVFAVPGSIFSEQSEGTHDLLKSGAKLVGCAKDVLEELRLENGPSRQAARDDKPLPEDLSPDEVSLVQALTGEPQHIDTLAKLTKLDTSTASSTLLLMEMKGIAKNLGGQNYVRL